jgi:hypothetical protein
LSSMTKSVSNNDGGTRSETDGGADAAGSAFSDVLSGTGAGGDVKTDAEAAAGEGEGRDGDLDEDGGAR